MSLQEKKFWIFLSALAILIVVSRWVSVNSQTHRTCYSSKYVSGIYETEDVQTLPQALNLLTVKNMVGASRSCRTRHRLKGKVVVRMLVDEHGNGIRYRVLSSSNHHLEHRVKRYAYDLKFLPAKLRGQTVRCWVNVKFQF